MMEIFFNEVSRFTLPKLMRKKSCYIMVINKMRMVSKTGVLRCKQYNFLHDMGNYLIKWIKFQIYVLLLLAIRLISTLNLITFWSVHISTPFFKTFLLIELNDLWIILCCDNMNFWLLKNIWNICTQLYVEYSLKVITSNKITYLP